MLLEGLTGMKFMSLGFLSKSQSHGKRYHSEDNETYCHVLDAWKGYVLCLAAERGAGEFEYISWGS